MSLKIIAEITKATAQSHYISIIDISTVAQEIKGNCRFGQFQESLLERLLNLYLLKKTSNSQMMVEKMHWDAYNKHHKNA